jgi:hypothetical protein
MGTNKLRNITNGTLSTDVMTKGYIDGEVAVVQGQIDNLNLSQYITETSGDSRYWR